MLSENFRLFQHLKFSNLVVATFFILFIFTPSSSVFATTLYSQTGTGTPVTSHNTGSFSDMLFGGTATSNYASMSSTSNYTSITANQHVFLKVSGISGTSCSDIAWYFFGSAGGNPATMATSGTGHVTLPVVGYDAFTFSPYNVSECVSEGIVNSSGAYFSGIGIASLTGTTFSLTGSSGNTGVTVSVWTGGTIVGYTPAYVLSDIAFPTCSDGIQNQDETAIDFGGVCPTIEIISSDIITSTTWNRDKLHLISGDISVSSGHTLIINPGTIVKFDTSTPSSLTINGTLDAEGDDGDDQSLGEIFFTSIKDDELLGIDTNSDGNSTSPDEGDWGGIIIGSGGVATFDKVVIRYAGASGTSEAEIYNNGGTLTMTNSHVAYGTTYGIKNNSGTSDISSSDIGFNDYGFYLAGGTASVTDNNKIHDNSSYGIYNNTVSSIDAEGNYWGDPTGPYYSTNTGGLGNPVSGYVDFDPWNYNLHFLIDPDCHTGDLCGSVRSNELRWKIVGDASAYSTLISSALSTWDALGNITITQDNSTPTLEFHKVTLDSVAWKGQWDPTQTPDYIDLNSYYLDNNTSSQVQHTITHELGHALGLDHSYTGNVMYFNQTSQTTLGPQDVIDYNSLWP